MQHNPDRQLVKANAERLARCKAGRGEDGLPDDPDDLDVVLDFLEHPGNYLLTGAEEEDEFMNGPGVEFDAWLATHQPKVSHPASASPSLSLFLTLTLNLTISD